MYLTPENSIQEFADNCIRCGLCARTDCGNYASGTPCLGDICESWLSGDETWFSFPFTCALCNRCTVECPVDLKANLACKPMRALGQAKYPQLNPKYRHFRTDLKYNLFSLMLARQKGGADAFEPIEGEPGINAKADVTAFFPGCSLNAYAPELTKLTFEWLQEQGMASYKVNLCCSATFFDTGFFDQFEGYREGFKAMMAEYGIKRLVVSCPHCGYILPQVLEGTDVEIVRLPDLLVEAGVEVNETGTYSMHDACYDRESCVYGEAVRKLLGNMTEVPLEHTRENTMCCGGGGMVSAYARDFCEYRRLQRLGEIDTVQTDQVISTCFSCVNSMQRSIGTTPVKHYLELVFGYDVDWGKVYDSVDAMYADPVCQQRLTTEDKMF